MAVANSVANVAGIAGPPLVNILVPDPNKFDSWFWFFILSASIFGVGGIIFCLFAENRQQNYCRKPKQTLPGAISMAQLYNPTTPKIPVVESITMDAFSRVGQEPKQDLSSPQVKGAKRD